ncbi:extracellular catalytic domain type 1 short-chain-length polyhydroxyalkanoate depolymerase [Wukongibacter sp. M2B1]|uniref:extracellular catalytic domain type 1 short-chain-length polyhydroxyalkanoate depolymerase n=1 Tax=Wukongibacter sp. M2B1 TaxID=3088895 RepID=UPI003D7AF5DD
MKTKKYKQLYMTTALFIIVTLVISPFSSFSQESGSFTSHTYGYRTYKLYVPSGYQSGIAVPLMVMMHGGTQDPDQFATGTRMNELAEENNFIVLYPDQPTSINSGKYWSWYKSEHQSRGSEEPEVIVGMTNQVKSNYTIDDSKVFIQGLSAGAAMSVVMGVTYPDVFKGIGVHSGLEYKAAEDQTSAYLAMFTTGGPDPVEQGRVAYQEMGSYATVVPTIVFHGTSDSTVIPKNGHNVLTQWATTNDLADDGSENGTIDDTADVTEQGQVSGGRSYTEYTYNSDEGNLVMKKVIVDGMGHAWSGGDSAGSYTDSSGPNATQMSWDFFMETSCLNEDTTAPTTTVSPAGGTYENSVTVTLSVNESAATYYTTDGTTPTTSSEQYTNPLQFTEDTTLKFFSVDIAENEEAVKTETYTIEHVQDTTSPVTTANPVGGTYENSVTVTLSVNESAATYYTTDGTTSTTSSEQYTSPLQFTEDTTLKFFSVDTAGNEEAVKAEIYTIEVAQDEVFKSIGSEDGYVGMYTADGLSSSISKVGDKGMFNANTYKTILSFDTSALSGKTVSGAKLRIYRKSISGDVTGIKVDIKSGTFEADTLESFDYSSGASAVNIATLAVPSSDDDFTEVDIPASALQYINTSGKTQIRLSGDTAVDFTADTLELYGGEDVGFEPQLIVIAN